jgi:PPOX class probable F420-dependent enzyme
MLMRDPNLSVAERAFLEGARRAILVTLAPDGRPRPVPICFVLEPEQPVLYTPLDEKPKAIDDVRRLARVRDIERDPRVSVVVDRWDEDWTRLGWLRLNGSAALLEPGGADHAQAVPTLRNKYEQYRAHDLDSRPIIRVAIERATSWGALGD